jgi:hypothetical protein
MDMQTTAPEGYPASLDLFNRPTKDVALVKRDWVDYAPNNAITEDAPIEFNIEANSLRYVDLSKTLLNVKAKVVKGDGTDIANTDNVAPINLTLQSLWRQVDLSLGQIPLPSVGTNYPYKSIVDVLLTNGEDAKKTQLQTQLYSKDAAGYMDTSEFGGNRGFNWRKEVTSGSQIVEMMGPLYLDLAQQNRALVNGVSVSIKLWPSSRQFRLMASDSPPPAPKADYKIKIMEATLKVCQVTVNAKVMLGHEEALNNGPALYPYSRSEIKTYTMAEGIQNYRIDNLFNGDVPTSMLVGLVAGDAYSGSYYKNPFNFANYDLNSMAFYLDNVPTPQKPFTPKYGEDAEGNYTTPYLALFGNKTGEDLGNYIDLRDFPRGYTLYRFDVAENDQNTKKGNTRLEMAFNTKLPHVVTVIVYAHFPAVMRIDKSRKIQL